MIFKDLLQPKSEYTSKGKKEELKSTTLKKENLYFPEIFQEGFYKTPTLFLEVPQH